MVFSNSRLLPLVLIFFTVFVMAGSYRKTANHSELVRRSGDQQGFHVKTFQVVVGKEERVTGKKPPSPIANGNPRGREGGGDPGAVARRSNFLSLSFSLMMLVFLLFFNFRLVTW